MRRRTSAPPCSPTVTAAASSFRTARSRSGWASSEASSRRSPRQPSSPVIARRSRRSRPVSKGEWAASARGSTIGCVLRRLRIENLVLIHEAELHFGPGLNAITGETGAGKTILAQAIGLLLGAKADSALVGPDAPEAYVEAELDVPGEVEGTEALGEQRPEGEDGLVLARRVSAEGRARAFAWGRAAATADVASAAEALIAMSGQFEQRRLARPAYQLEVLDSFLGESQARLLADTRGAWRSLQATRTRHEELTGDAALLEARTAELRALVEDTEGLEPET